MERTICRENNEKFEWSIEDGFAVLEGILAIVTAG
jgi:hypothetical protein